MDVHEAGSFAESNYAARGRTVTDILCSQLPRSASPSNAQGCASFPNNLDGWLVVLNANFLNGGVCCLGTGQILALRDNNGDGDAQDAGELKVLVDHNSGFGRFPVGARHR